MKTRIKTGLALAMGLALATGMAVAQDTKPQMTPEQQAMMAAYEKAGAVRAEHKQLDVFVGNWTTKATVVFDPSTPPEVTTGKETAAWVFGGRAVEMKYNGQHAGKPFEGRSFMGFDNLKNKFYMTWQDDMATGIWIPYGTYDAASKTYNLSAPMDDALKPGSTYPVRVAIRVVDNDHYVFEMYETREGKESKTMTIEYTRA